MAPRSELQEFVRAVPLFAGLLPSEVDRITMVMNPVQVAAGEVICTEGEPGHEFYVIAAGEAPSNTATRSPPSSARVTTSVSSPCSIVARDRRPCGR